MFGDFLGVDVGFSQVQKSTGIACLFEDRLTLYRANSSWQDRLSQLPQGFAPSIIAIDGPLLPASSEPLTVRLCEQHFSRGLFNRRCKPGLSHFGTGLMLREAARETMDQFGKHFFGPNCELDGNVVEAFPNLFLGVMVREDQYATIPKLRRGQKFDWLYEAAQAKLQQLRHHIIVPDVVYDRAQIESDHELRAAIICLFTAALAGSQKAVKAGDADGGWFWLPPMDLWEPWAIAAANDNFTGP